ncbi:MAG TPA: hypothetical protein DEB39_14965 [Planctomycetaceae bacterium]|nr:hypothetical protein [Planctomycetaceae bacterium]
MKRLFVQNFGQLKSAEVTFGDLTVFTGPQASGKSVFLQLFKLLLDKDLVGDKLRKDSAVWKTKRRADTLRLFSGLYFGEGMGALLDNERLGIKQDGKSVSLSDLLPRGESESPETVFYIPAQRVLAFRDGRPRSFSDFAAGDPFCVRNFSDTIRRLTETDFSDKEILFPRPYLLKETYRKLLERAVFHDFSLKFAVDGNSRKRLTLAKNDTELPFMVWSAGQREFMPLLLGLYWLLPSGKTVKRPDVGFVVIEEPEMGLHPNATSVVLLLILELIWRGYKVCLSTHSPHVLDVVWAINTMIRCNANKKYALQLFGVDNCFPNYMEVGKVTKAALDKTYKVYYFDVDAGDVRDISGLDPSAADAFEAGWGGLTGFSGNVADVVAQVVREADRG